MASRTQARGNFGFVVAAGVIVGSLVVGGVSIADAAGNKPVKPNIATDLQCATPCVDATEISGSVNDATNAGALDGLDSTAFLRTTATAADSDTLDGLDSAVFARKVKADTVTLSGEPMLAAGECTSALRRYTGSIHVLDDTTDFVLPAPPSSQLAVTGTLHIGPDTPVFPGSTTIVHEEDVWLAICNVSPAAADPNVTFRFLVVR